jgi:hypothetical protein
MLEPREVLGLVRRGLALARPEQLAVVTSCSELEVVGGAWVPRWALEAEAALTEAGAPPEQAGRLFAQGRARVLAELEERVRAGRLPAVLRPRLAYQPDPIDEPTRSALTLALRQHRAGCDQCRGAEPCLLGAELAEELELLFPSERRQHRRL